MKPGEGAARFIVDAHNGVPAEVMKANLIAGHYGNLRVRDMEGWFAMAGRKI